MTPTEIVRGFWGAMRDNDFAATAHRWLAPDYLGLWPQTAEVIRGPDAYARVNDAFPGKGDWRFEEISLLADGDRVVTDMRITNAPLEVAVRCLSFHEVRAGQIIRQTEFWPDSHPVPVWRQGVLKVDPAISKW